VVLASATLSIGGDFRNFAAQIGLPEHAETLALPSPFDLRRQARLEVPALRHSPDQRDAHVAEVVAWLDAALDWSRGNLVLFTSRAKLEACYSALPLLRRQRVLAQGSRSKSTLLASHAAAVNAGQGSTLFGLASFGEGLDLPGRLCETVVITQLPFAVPTDPVGATFAEWLEAKGRNAFVEVSIPQATRTLIQYCGRLIRGEADSGRIVILDNRLLTRRYGARMLAALPDFERKLGESPSLRSHG
jgi:ATP-dependent DNA helicase DinG